MIKALVFDFDGLILETEGAIFQSWQELYRRYNYEVPLDHWQRNIGTAEERFDPLAELEQQIGREVNRGYDLSWRMQREKELIADQSPRPGVVEMLQRAQEMGLKIGLASSSPCEWVTSHLGRLGLLSFFDIMTTQEDVKRTKPEPELYLMAVEWLGIAPHEAVAFEDSMYGLIAAKRAGLYCVVVPTPLTDNLPLDQADLRLGSLDEITLEDLLRLLNRKSNGAGGQAG